MCERRTPQADTVIGFLNSPRPHLGSETRESEAVRSAHSSEAAHRDRGLEPTPRAAATSVGGSNPASAVPVGANLADPSAATRVEALTDDIAPSFERKATLTRSESAAVQAEIAEAVREVMEGRLDLELGSDALAPTGTDDWTPPGHGRKSLAVVATLGATPASSGPSAAMMSAAPAAPPTRQFTPDGTVVGMHPLLRPSLPGKPVFDERDITESGTVVAMHPMMLVPGTPLAQPNPGTLPLTISPPGSRTVAPSRPTAKPAPSPRAKLAPLEAPPLVRPPLPKAAVARTTVTARSARTPAKLPPAEVPAPPTANAQPVAVQPAAAQPVAAQPAAAQPVAVQPAAAPVVSGVRAQVLGSYLGHAPAPATALEAPDHESLEIGSKPGTPFAGDPFVGRYHAAFVPGPNGVVYEDFGSENGVYVRVRGTVSLADSATLRVGRQLLSFERLRPPPASQQTVKRVGSPDPGYWGRIEVLLDADRSAAAVAVRDTTAKIGRAGECALSFANDDRVAETHCTLACDGTTVTLTDNGGEHGVWVRLPSGATVAYGSELLIGDTRVRLDRNA